MRDVQPRNIWRFLSFKRVLAANVVIFAIVTWGIVGEFMRSREMQKEIDRLGEQSAQMEKENGRLEDMGKRFSSNAMLEREARTKLNLQKPGEEVVVVRTGEGREGTVDSGQETADDGQRTTDGGRATMSSGPGTNIGRWWRYFFR